MPLYSDPTARFTLLQDDDAHWYLCPAERVGEAQDYFASVTDFWSRLPDDEDCPDEPGWLDPVDGPSSISFLDPYAT